MNELLFILTVAYFSSSDFFGVASSSGKTCIITSQPHPDQRYESLYALKDQRAASLCPEPFMCLSKFW